MTREMIVVAVSLVIALGLSSGIADAQKAPKEPKVVVVLVDCSDPKKSIQDAINAAVGRTTILVSGTCVETVIITADDVTLIGDELSPPVIEGSITIDGAQRTLIQDIDITKDDLAPAGVDVTNGASARLQGLDVTGSRNNGIRVENNSFATIDDTISIMTGGAEGVFVVALGIRDAGSARVTDSFFESDDPEPGTPTVGLIRAAHLRMEGDNTIKNTGTDTTGGDPSARLAITVSNGSNLRIQNGTNVIDGNVRVLAMGEAEFRGTSSVPITVDGQLSVSRKSDARARNVSFTGDITVTSVSLLSLGGTVDVGGDVDCSGQSFVSGIGALNFTGAGSNFCLEP